jgi:AraC-like DNA-binding protein
MARINQRNRQLAILVIRKAAKYIDSKDGSCFVIAEIAKYCDCQVRFLNTAFQGLCQCSAKDFLQIYQAIRMRGAIKSDPNKSIEELARRCGMSLTPTMKRVFAALHGIRIADFREQCIQELEAGSLAITNNDCMTASDLVEDALKRLGIPGGAKGEILRLSSCYNSGIKKARQV